MRHGLHHAGDVAAGHEALAYAADHHGADIAPVGRLPAGPQEAGGQRFVEGIQGARSIEADARHAVDDIEQDQLAGSMHLTVSIAT